MRAQVLEAFNEAYVLKDISKPNKPNGQDILIQVLAASYCHTDAVFASGAMWKGLPRVGSHEFAGKIVALGPDVDSHLGLQVDMHVGVPGRAYQPCGECYECRNNDGDPKGYGVWCTKAGNLGLTRDGGFEEYAIADSRQVTPIPEAMTAVDTAPLMCAGLTIWNALETAGVDMSGAGENSKKTIAIMGAGGGLGHLGVQFATKLGCKVIAVDLGEKPLKLLKDIVANGQMKEVSVIDAESSSPEEVRLDIFGQPQAMLEGEKGADAVLILPESQQALEYGMKLLKNHSTCVVVSFPADGFHIQPRDLVFRHIKMVGVLVGRNRQLRSMLAFASKHDIRARSVKYRLEDLNKLVEDYHKGVSGKLVIDMETRP